MKMDKPRFCGEEIIKNSNNLDLNLTPLSLSLISLTKDQLNAPHNPLTLEVYPTSKPSTVFLLTAL